MRLTTKLICSLCVLALSASGLSAAQVALPAKLSDLLPAGQFAVIGGLKFEAFNYSIIGDMPSADQVNVVVTPSGTGIRFQGPFLDLPGGIGNGASDATLGFKVTGQGINSVTLSGNPSLLGGSGTAAVTETFSELPTTKLDIYDNLLNGSVPTSLSASVNLASPVSTLTVVKDILLVTKSTTTSATLSFIDQEFMPEPASGLLMMFGLIGACGFRRGRRS